MWEQCGDVLYYDQVGHGVSPPSDPTEMATFYQTCKPIFDANPPPDPDAVILDPIVASVTGRGDNSEEKVSSGAIDLGADHPFEILHVATIDTSLPAAERASAFCNVQRTASLLGVSFEHDLSSYDAQPKASL